MVRPDETDSDSLGRSGMLGLLILFWLITLPFRGCQGCANDDDFEGAAHERGMPPLANPLEQQKRAQEERSEAAITAWKNVYSPAPCADTVHNLRRGLFAEGWYVVVMIDGEPTLVSMFDVYPPEIARSLNAEFEVTYRNSGRKTMTVREGFQCE